MKYLMTTLAIIVIGAYAVQAANEAKVIKISAKRYSFTPSEITLKKGVPYVLELTTQDRSHGMAIPAMDKRVTIEPGQTAEIKLTPEKTGNFEFHCDVMCGLGHDSMTGTIKVVD
ncbi:MAG TPA: cupredoxin domain-containing protein [Planktothrix sp.]|jgi:cytochrome c oxidase subunit 2